MVVVIFIEVLSLPYFTASHLLLAVLLERTKEARVGLVVGLLIVVGFGINPSTWRHKRHRTTTRHNIVGPIRTIL